MNRQQPRNTDLLRLVADALLSAEANHDGRAILNVSPIKLQFWGQQLQGMLKPAQRGAPGKSMQHVHWAMQYWVHRLDRPEDVAGAVSAAQKFSALLWSWDAKPDAQTVKRVARSHRNEVFKLFETDPVSRHLLNGLREYLKKHDRVGRW